MARFYGEQNEILKISLKYFSVGLSALSFFSFGFSVAFGLVIFSAFIFFLDAHYEVMETRFSQLSQDLDISEKQLRQAVSQNMDLENQLSVAVQKNQDVTNELVQIKEEVVHLREKMVEKEQMIERTHGLLEDSTSKIQALVSEMIDIKKNVSEKARHFSEQVASTEKKIKGLFDEGAEKSNQLKESRQFREQMDRYLEENFPGMLSN